jgi:hypothetical protein
MAGSALSLDDFDSDFDGWQEQTDSWGKGERFTLCIILSHLFDLNE